MLPREVSREGVCSMRLWSPAAFSFFFAETEAAFLCGDLERTEEEVEEEGAAREMVLKRTLLDFGFGTFCAATCCLAFFSF